MTGSSLSRNPIPAPSSVVCMISISIVDPSWLFTVSLDIKAEDSDDAEDETHSDNEVTAAERVRQAAESVPLRNHDHVPDVLRIANAWEKIALKQEECRAASTQNKGKRKAHPSLTNARKRPRQKSPSPPPNHSRYHVDTCMGRQYFYLEDIPGEKEMTRELRIYNASEELIAAAC